MLDDWLRVREISKQTISRAMNQDIQEVVHYARMTLLCAAEFQARYLQQCRRGCPAGSRRADR